MRCQHAEVAVGANSHSPEISAATPCGGNWSIMEVRLLRANWHDFALWGGTSIGQESSRDGPISLHRKNSPDDELPERYPGFIDRYQSAIQAHVRATTI